MRPKVASGEVAQADALDRALRALESLATVIEPLVQDYNKRLNG